MQHPACASLTPSFYCRNDSGQTRLRVDRRLRDFVDEVLERERRDIGHKRAVEQFPKELHRQLVFSRQTKLRFPDFPGLDTHRAGKAGKCGRKIGRVKPNIERARFLRILLHGQTDRNRDISDVGEMQIAKAYVQCKTAPRPLLLCDRLQQLAERVGRQISWNPQTAFESNFWHAFLFRRR
jgi:hypothetical protein